MSRNPKTKTHSEGEDGSMGEAAAVESQSKGQKKRKTLQPWLMPLSATPWRKLRKTGTLYSSIHPLWSVLWLRQANQELGRGTLWTRSFFCSLRFFTPTTGYRACLCWISIELYEYEQAKKKQKLNTASHERRRIWKNAWRWCGCGEQTVPPLWTGGAK